MSFLSEGPKGKLKKRNWFLLRGDESSAALLSHERSELYNLLVEGFFFAGENYTQKKLGNRMT